MSAGRGQLQGVVTPAVAHEQHARLVVVLVLRAVCRRRQLQLKFNVMLWLCGVILWLAASMQLRKAQSTTAAVAAAAAVHNEMRS